MRWSSAPCGLRSGEKDRNRKTGEHSLVARAPLSSHCPDPGPVKGNQGPIGPPCRARIIVLCHGNKALGISLVARVVGAMRRVEEHASEGLRWRLGGRGGGRWMEPGVPAPNRRRGLRPPAEGRSVAPLAAED